MRLINNDALWAAVTDARPCRATQLTASARPPDRVVHKWRVFRTICTARPMLGVSERALSVLNALLTFHPETTLTGEALTVFPSNEQLSLRAHGMPASTLRRHLAVLVDAGLVIRRDSPNGKRYARKGRGGEFEFRSARPVTARRLAAFEQVLRDRGGGFQGKTGAPGPGPRRLGLGDGIERGQRRAGERQRLSLGKVA